MIAYLAITALTVLALAELAVIYLRERAHDDERQGLLDRINAPQAAQIAATERLIPSPPPAEPEPPFYVATTDDDLLIDGRLA